MQELIVCPWYKNYQWVYSITFDEALVDLHKFAIPILEKYHVPGHLEVVVGQLGEIRQLFNSSYNGLRHMNADELKIMVKRGWGIGNHSWSHSYLNKANFDRELDEAKKVLEETINQPITTYCAPGSNANMSEEILNACKELGYLSAMGIYEALNRPEDNDLLWLKRVYLHENGPITHDAEFDPYRKVQHAIQDRGWIIDYCHCPLEEPLHPRKDCSASQLEERLDIVTHINNGDVWLATIEEANDYRYLARHLNQTVIDDHQIQLEVVNLPAEVQNKYLTFETSENLVNITSNGKLIRPYRKTGELLFDLDLGQKQIIEIKPKV